MSALRQPLRRRAFAVILFAAVLLAAVAMVDWARPPQRQASVQLYQRLIIAPYRSLVRPRTKSFVHCRYLPTCSQYSVYAVQTYGFPKGLWLTLKRVCRCGPWVRFGTFDPIP